MYRLTYFFKERSNCYKEKLILGKMAVGNFFLGKMVGNANITITIKATVFILPHVTKKKKNSCVKE